MNNIKVSIIVPIYNVEKYLERCMQSLLNQTLKEIEVILVDDGSPDNCPQMCEEYAKKDTRVKVVHKENDGLGFARNSGLEIATGEYVAFVDSDDYVELSMYKTLYEVAKKQKCDVVYCGFYKQLSNKDFKKICECNVYTEYNDDDVKKLIPDFIASEPYNKNEYKHDMSVWHSIYKNELIKNNHLQFVSERIYSSEDIPFQIDFLKNAQKVAFIPDNLYYYCYNNTSLTKKVNTERFQLIKSTYKLISEKAKKEDFEGLRTKRLFIGNVRAYIRKVVNSKITKSEKKSIIRELLNDEIWDEIRKIYRPSYLPTHRQIMLAFIYTKSTFLVYYFTKTLNKISSL